MRPDVAQAFDRMAAAARADGIALVIVERLPLRRRAGGPLRPPPGPEVGRAARASRCTATPPSSTSGRAPRTAGSPRNAGRFHFVQRYAWEPLALRLRPQPALDACGAIAPRPTATARRRDARLRARRASRAPINRAAQRWSVSATLLAAQLYAESGFNPFAVSAAGAQGIAQFMPRRRRAAYGLRDPFDAAAAIDAQAHLMRDLLRRFGAVPLALAAYNAGAGARWPRCGCVPAIPETRGYVARILGLMGGAGELVTPAEPGTGGAAGALTVHSGGRLRNAHSSNSSWSSSGSSGASARSVSRLLLVVLEPLLQGGGGERGAGRRSSLRAELARLRDLVGRVDRVRVRPSRVELAAQRGLARAVSRRCPHPP